MAKKALLIGINRYRIAGADLRGCVNDVKNMKAVLTRYYGFKSGDIGILTDLRATTRAMMEGIKRLVSSGRKGDVLLLHYSGHGSNVPDKSGDEADFRDEILCPTDLDWKKPLTDDWLRATFDRLRTGVNLTVIMDCCHSGSNTRVLAPPDAPIIPRYLPNPLDLLAAESGRKLKGKVRGGLRPPATRKRGASDVVEVDLREVLVTGCRDVQTSADAYIDGAYTGALTFSLVEAIKQRKGRLSHRELHDLALRQLANRGFDQVPQLEGRREALDRPFLAPLA